MHGFVRRYLDQYLTRALVHACNKAKQVTCWGINSPPQCTPLPPPLTIKTVNIIIFLLRFLYDAFFVERHTQQHAHGPRVVV